MSENISVDLNKQAKAIQQTLTQENLPEKKGVYLVIDTEASGLHPLKHGLIQIAALALDAQLEILDQFCVDICPPPETIFDSQASQIHNISQERIQQGLTYPQAAQTLANFIHKHFIDTPITIGQFYPFDFARLEYLFAYCGYSEKEIGQLFSNHFIDTKVLAEAINLKAKLNNQPIPFTTTSLSKPGGLKDKFQVTSYTAHDALGDCLATREVLIHLLSYINGK